MKNTLYIDLETYNGTVKIKTAGTYRYAESAEILLFAYAWEAEPPKVWDLTVSTRMPDDLRDYLNRPNTVVCSHNAAFERAVLARYGFRIPRWRDTMVRAYRHGLPGELGLLSQIFKLGAKGKDAEVGRSLIQLFSVKQKNGKRLTRHDLPREWAQFVEYNRLDIEAMRELDRRIPAWNDTAFEDEVWALDRVINDRGFYVDLDLAQAAIVAVAEERGRRNARTSEATDGEVGAATQRDALLAHILDHYGVSLPDMRAATLERRLHDHELPEPVKELLRLRIQSATNSTSKYKRVINGVCHDGRLRGTLQYCGATRTGRWAGRLFQPQNLPRPTLKPAEIEAGIGAIKAGCADLIYEDVSNIASQALRGVIISTPGKKIVASDLKSIEGRVLAWLAGEEWKIQAYRDLDAGVGYDMYVWAYAKTFNVEPSTVIKKQRQIGKPIELALGYGGGVGAFITFAAVYKVDLAEMAEQVWETLPDWAINDSMRYWEYCKKERNTHGLKEKVFIACDSVKRLWRVSNAMIEAFWHQIEGDVRAAISCGYATERKYYRVDVVKNWLRIRLPSGRYLCYPAPRIEDKKITYLGMDTYSKKWGRVTTYGGKLTENFVQAVSRDVFAHGVLLAEKAGYQTLIYVHDEDVTETPDRSEFNEKHLSRLLSTVPAWAKGLPLAAEGFEGYRYRKDD